MLKANQSGVIHIILLGLVVIALVIGVILAITVGLDNVYQQSSDTSLFSEESKIHELREKAEEKKAEILKRLNEAKKSSEGQEEAEQSTRSPSSDSRLDALSGRLNERQTAEDY